MNKKILIIVIACLASGILIIMKVFLPAKLAHKETGEKVLPEQAPPVSELTVNWQEQLPSIKEILGSVYTEIGSGLRQVAVYEEADLTGDGRAEALVALGTGGAYTDSFMLMIMENGRPAPATFVNEDGSRSFIVFLSGASVMNGESVEMLPEKQAIYAGHWSRSGGEDGGLSSCAVEAYKWNPETFTFDFSKEMSEEERSVFCRKVSEM